jgi:hypothetical protein
MITYINSCKSSHTTVRVIVGISVEVVAVEELSLFSEPEPPPHEYISREEINMATN